MTPTQTHAGAPVVRIVLADDDARLRQALRSLLDEIAGFEVVGEAADGRVAVRLAQALQPDVMLMDVRMPDLDGIEATRQSLAAAPGTRVIALSLHADPSFVDAMLAAGASGYLLKDRAAEELESALRKVCDGGTCLSPGLR